ncbi:MAG TPA: right-handed parallel beta-helix repeat-containing protein, partial [Candidatus Sulfotelmatobacter sp.]|nr:right-handed parallel beta-helix repeat-containing protein [Candidatus Sulfotelmatobacter sp.]
AVVDPSEPFQAAWQPATEIGPGVYRASSPRKPASLFFEAKVLAELDFRRANKEGPWHWKQLLASGPPRGGFRFIRALWMYHPSEKALYLHLPDNAAPAEARLGVVWTREAVITLRNATEASVRGLTLAHGANGIALQEGARACTVAQCVVGPWDKNGIVLGGGASGCLVQSNQVFRGAFEDWNPGDNSKERYEVWQIHKLVGYYDRVGIELLRPGANNRIDGNHVYETFDGIDLGEEFAVETLSKPLPHPEAGQGTEIAFNLIERTRDSGIELGGGCVQVRVHHNTLRQTHGGLRFKLPRVGPVFIYRNLLTDGSPFNIWYSMDDSPAEGYIYHNTIRGGSAGVIFSSFSPGEHTIGAPHWHYYNNLVVAKDGFFRNWNVKAPVNFTADYNLAAGGGKPWPNDPSKDSHSRYVEQILLAEDGRPAADSLAVDTGLDLSTAWAGKPLPGCEPGYFQGKGPDMGAFEVR